MGTVNTQELLAERGKTHGEYGEHARCTQAILRVLQSERGYPMLSDMQKESLHMIAHKMGRIVTGNPNLEDHWDDIAGYAVLISQRLRAPIPVFEKESDPYGALALAWNIPREEAKKRVHALQYQTKAAHEAQAKQVDLSAAEAMERELEGDTK